MARKPNAIPPKIQLQGGDELEIDKPDDGLVVADGDDVHATGSEATDTGATEESVESLKAQLEAETKRREAAERAAAQASTTIRTQHDDIETTQLRVLENAMAAEAAAKREAMAAYRTARESGDYDAEADALDKLQKANFKIETLTSGKNELERRIEDKKNLPDDPVERYAMGLDSRGAKWVREHPEIILDGRTAELEDAHYGALRERLQPGTPAYFRFIEDDMGLNGEPAAPPPPPARQERRPAPPPSAPPSRTTVASAPANLPNGVTMMPDGRVRLDERHRAAARISNLSDKEYFDSMMQLHREGKLGITTH